MKTIGYETRSAIRSHTCFLCHGEIKKRTTYVRWCTISDDNVFDTKLHKDCELIVDNYCADTHEEEIDRECIFEWIGDQLKEVGIPFDGNDPVQMKELYLKNIRQ